jgi:hypothetical protein
LHLYRKVDMAVQCNAAPYMAYDAGRVGKYTACGNENWPNLVMWVPTGDLAGFERKRAQ